MQILYHTSVWIRLTGNAENLTEIDLFSGLVLQGSTVHCELSVLLWIVLIFCVWLSVWSTIPEFAISLEAYQDNIMKDNGPIGVWASCQSSHFLNTPWDIQPSTTWLFCCSLMDMLACNIPLQFLILFLLQPELYRLFDSAPWF